MKTASEVAAAQAAATAKRATYGIIVARFQTPVLHEAHIDLINTVLSKHPKVVIFLGLPFFEESTINNPFDLNIRIGMLKEVFGDRIEYKYIDNKECDHDWSDNLDSQIAKTIGPRGTCLLYGSRDSFIPHYKGKYPVEELVSEIMVSGTELRARAAEHATFDVSARSAICWVLSRIFPAPKVSVDVVVFNENKTKILLGRKKKEPLFRFFGGFATNKGTFEDDGARETREECNNIEIGELKYVCSLLVDDWRVRDEVNKIKTIFYACKYVFGTPEPTDDMKGGEVKWFDLATIKDEQIMPAHRPLLAKLRKFNTANLD